MTSKYDNHDDELDWPEDDVPQKAGNNSPDAGVPEPEDDASRLPVRRTRHPQPRKRTGYRPPSELDRD